MQGVVKRVVRLRRPVVLGVEQLETRTVLSPTSWPGLSNPLLSSEPNDTLLQADALGNLAQGGRAEAVGAIATGGSDVDWYSFSLTQAATVSIATLAQAGGSQLDSMLTLYTGEPQQTLTWQRLAVADDTGPSPDASLTINLSPGQYFVAVSGYGNSFFHPGIADSGLAGSSGEYGLLLTAELLPSSYLQVIRTTPTQGASQDASPLQLLAAFNRSVDPATVTANAVRLVYSQDATFGPGDTTVTLAGVSYNQLTHQIRIQPGSPLAPGFYRLRLFGNASAHPGSVITDLNGNPLGKSATNPLGADHLTTFEISGIEGTQAAGPNDTLGTAAYLGHLAPGGLFQVAGVVGDDPTDPVPFNSNDVDLYQFTITGPGQSGLTAEAFAGRIGSPLDASISLFDSNGNWIRSNEDSKNPTVDANGWQPFIRDPLLFAGLTQGTYYIAVTGSRNRPGMQGGFDPLTSHSGTASTAVAGEYVLRLSLIADNTAPQVVSVTLPTEGEVLNAPPTRIVVTFSEAIDRETLDSGTQILNANGDPVGLLRWVSYDEGTNQVTFLLQEALANGQYELHFSGAAGLCDRAGNPLVGNDPGGDYVVHFEVNGPTRGSPGNPLLWLDQEPNQLPASPQQVGPLFPSELASGVTFAGQLSHDPNASVNDHEDDYRIQIVETGWFELFLESQTPQFPDGVVIAIAELPGFQLQTTNGHASASIRLDPGIYTLQVSFAGWSGAQPETLEYRLSLEQIFSNESPQPLSLSPSPLIQINAAKNPSGPVLPPPSRPPAQEPDSGGNTPVVTTRPIGLEGVDSTTVSFLISFGNSGRPAATGGKSLARETGPFPGLASLRQDRVHLVGLERRDSGGGEAVEEAGPTVDPVTRESPSLESVWSGLLAESDSSGAEMDNVWQPVFESLTQTLGNLHYEIVELLGAPAAAGINQAQPVSLGELPPSRREAVPDSAAVPLAEEPVLLGAAILVDSGEKRAIDRVLAGGAGCVAFSGGLILHFVSRRRHRERQRAELIKLVQVGEAS